jgi:flagellar biosynthesis/type III secretory pathway M-ring protein FliF/YscJ
MTVQEFFKSVLNFIFAVVILIVILGLYFKAASAYHEYSNENKPTTVAPSIKNNKATKSTH